MAISVPPWGNGNRHLVRIFDNLQQLSLRRFMDSHSRSPTVAQSSADGGPAPAVERCARFVQRHLIWLLLAIYLLAAFWPRFGVALREWQWFQRPAGIASISLPLLLLAVLLFCASLVTEVRGLRSVVERPATLLLGLLLIWFAPALYVFAVSFVLRESASAGALLGLVLVATMPVANSSVGWSLNARGNLALNLALIVISILLSPWVTPHLLQLLGLSLSVTERANCDLLVARFSGRYFIVWVILPTLFGFLCRWWIGGDRIDRVRGWIILSSAGSLLLLNYLNAALALPQLLAQSHGSLLALTFSMAVGMCLSGIALALVLAKCLGESSSALPPLLFGLSMKHTGLALVLAGTVLDQEPGTILMIVVATVVQHFIAGITHWCLQRYAMKE